MTEVTALTGFESLYFLWGLLKDSVYRNKPRAVEGLKGESKTAVDKITE
jgi:hypothetical protein